MCTAQGAKAGFDDLSMTKKCLLYYNQGPNITVQGSATATSINSPSVAGISVELKWGDVTLISCKKGTEHLQSTVTCGPKGKTLKPPFPGRTTLLTCVVKAETFTPARGKPANTLAFEGTCKSFKYF
jgi:hypothetical protein